MCDVVTSAAKKNRFFGVSAGRWLWTVWVRSVHGMYALPLRSVAMRLRRMFLPSRQPSILTLILCCVVAVFGCCRAKNSGAFVSTSSRDKEARAVARLDRRPSISMDDDDGYDCVIDRLLCWPLGDVVCDGMMVC